MKSKQLLRLLLIFFDGPTAGFGISRMDGVCVCSVKNILRAIDCSMSSFN